MEFKRISKIRLVSKDYSSELFNKILNGLEQIDNFPFQNDLTKGKENLNNLERIVNLRCEGPSFEEIYLEVLDRDKSSKDSFFYVKNINYSDEESLKKIYKLVF